MIKTFKDSDTEAETRPLILVVDDEADIREFMSMELMDTYRVIEAEDGVQGLAQLKEHFPDLVVSDLIMPNMDGIAFCKQLKNDPDTDHIPIIMLTAKSDVNSQVDGLQCGADDYVTKPFNIVLLKARIHNLLENRRMLCERYMELALQRQKSPVPAQFKENKFLDDLVAILKEHHMNWNFSADDFAKVAGMSLRTLQRKLKALVNRSPAEFMSDYRMQRACALLIQTDKSITEIAFEVGYDESSSFSRVFKRYYAMSPSEYRQAHQ